MRSIMITLEAADIVPNLQKRQHPIASKFVSLTAARVWSQCEEHGIKFEHADEGGLDDEDWNDIQEEMEDFWMRDPKASSEHSQALLFELYCNHLIETVLVQASVDLEWQDGEPLPSTPGKDNEVVSPLHSSRYSGLL